MGHIIDEVVLDLRVTLLAEDDHNGKNKGDQQHQCKDHRRDHEAHTGEDIGVHIGEVDLHHTHLR